jgi:dihydrodipicolinate synthase/N-acetylneuraminate lyase
MERERSGYGRSGTGVSRADLPSNLIREQPYDGLTLFGQSGNRKYLNAAERLRFIEAARRAPPKIRLWRLP